ncbi:MAG: hypothetical protein AAF125_03620, partial [Chloroflexota bacterium]
ETALSVIRDPESEVPVPPYALAEAQAYAMLGLVRSAQALDAYDDYLTLAQSRADSRIQSAAGALESRFTFELRLDDGSYFIPATFRADNS